MMRLKTYIAAALFAVCPIGLLAQSSGLINAGFEDCSDAGWAVGWLQVQHAGDRAYRYSCDSHGAFAGRNSARLEQVAPQEFGMFVQRIDAKPFLGKRVAFEAQIRAAKIDVDGGGIFLRIDGPSDQILRTDSESGRTHGTHDWQKKRVVIEVDPKAVVIEVGVMIEAMGTIWADNLVLSETSDSETKRKTEVTKPHFDFNDMNTVREKPQRRRSVEKNKE
jgi:hypothetical protein